MANDRTYPILFVDDEHQNLIAFRFALEDQFAVLTAQSGAEALVVLERTDVAVLLCDQRMPGMTGVAVCEAAQRIRPDAVRMIMTAYSDIHDAMDAMNRGQVARYLLKPWRNEELAEVLRTAVDFFHLQRSAQEMEMRLLGAGSGHVAIAAKTSLLHEISTPLHSLVVTLEQSAPMLAGLQQRIESASDDALRAVVADLIEVHQDASLAADQLRGVTDRYRRTHKAASPRSNCGSVIASTARIVRREVERVARFDVVLHDSPDVAMDSTVLGQVLLNLIMNAAQAIEGAAMKGASVTVDVRREGQEAVITVRDTGPGIAEELTERIFEPCFTTRADGTGMGLAIARELAERHDGQLRARSVAGEYACFELRLPELLAAAL